MRITKAPPRYIKPIIGIILLATEAILCMPPIIITQSKAPKKRPVKIFGTENSVLITRAILLICGMFPEPIAVIIIRNAKRIPAHFIFNACSM